MRAPGRPPATDGTGFFDRQMLKLAALSFIGGVASKPAAGGSNA